MIFPNFSSHKKAEMISNVNKLVKHLQETNQTMAFAESITCGLASHQLNTIKGTSKVFRGAVICYHESVKTSLLGVSPSLIRKYTAESQQVTDALARGILNLIDADIYAAVTGLASPDGSESAEKPTGSVFFTVRYKNKVYRRDLVFRGEPLQIRKKACDELYGFIFECITGSL
jgi:PncC family amidohydrolase